MDVEGSRKAAVSLTHSIVWLQLSRVEDLVFLLFPEVEATDAGSVTFDMCRENPSVHAVCSVRTREQIGGPNTPE